jgi:uncharacterized membrane protein
LECCEALACSFNETTSFYLPPAAASPGAGRGTSDPCNVDERSGGRWITGGKAMTTEGLTTVVVGYDDTNTALQDFHDLERVHEEGRLPSYDAAVVERMSDSTHRVVATTIDESRKRIVRGAGLGLAVGLIFSPALVPAACGAAIGGIVASIVDDVASFNHADFAQMRRLIDDSASNLIVISDSPHAQQLEVVASSRANRTIVPFAPVDIQLLNGELKRTPPLRLPT